MQAKARLEDEVESLLAKLTQFGKTCDVHTHTVQVLHVYTVHVDTRHSCTYMYMHSFCEVCRFLQCLDYSNLQAPYIHARALLLYCAVLTASN